MISKIISRAASLRELASNPKSFSNCPDLHGGVSDLSEDRICMKPLRVKEGDVPLPLAGEGALKFDYALARMHRSLLRHVPFGYCVPRAAYDRWLIVES